MRKALAYLVLLTFALGFFLALSGTLIVAAAAVALIAALYWSLSVILGE